jgi:site-specific DNA-cytosine methylase
VLSDLRELGYCVKTYIMDAESYYLPQFRTRLYLVGVRRNVPNMCRSPEDVQVDIGKALEIMKRAPQRPAANLLILHNRFKVCSHPSDVFPCLYYIILRIQYARLLSQADYLYPNDHDAVVEELKRRELAKSKADTTSGDQVCKKWVALRMDVAEKRIDSCNSKQ